MHPHPPALPSIRFVGQESQLWGNIGTKGIRSWAFVQPIDAEHIGIGAHITVTRLHPMHEDSLISVASAASASTVAGRGILLEGTIVGLSGVVDGDALFAVSNDLEGGLTTVSVPVRRTNIDPEGGWMWLVRPLWGGLFKFPMFISTRRLQSPGSLACAVCDT